MEATSKFEKEKNVRLRMRFRLGRPLVHPVTLSRVRLTEHAGVQEFFQYFTVSQTIVRTGKNVATIYGLPRNCVVCSISYQ